ncbi:MAG: hypothetical protein ACYCW6_22300 [Candidatus Xenobia bacterium]
MMSTLVMSLGTLAISTLAFFVGLHTAQAVESLADRLSGLIPG